MNLTEVFALLAFIVSLLMLIVTTVHVTFEIAWKLFYEKSEHSQKKD